MQYDSVYSKSEHNGNGHNLSSLFSQLPENIVSELEIISAEEHNGISLNSFFKKYKNHFIEWRYSFEGKAQAYNANEILVVLNTLNKWGSKNLQ